ncbi:AAA family ATPase [Streptosporangium sp. KLBMP 9127]|nr:AAA family ATPase [Streptosporangium sp. KLBMP 9127]
MRRIVGDRINFQGWGYRFEAEQDELDLLRFQALAAAGRSAIRNGDPVLAAELLRDAIGMWQDQPLAEFSSVPMIAGEVDRFTELYLSVYEDWVELEIELGRYVEPLTGLDILAARYPTRERIAASRMTALARCGRTAEALSHFEALRRHLAAEMGIDPSPVLKSLYQDILRGDGSQQPDRLTKASRSGPALVRPVQTAANQLPRDIADFVGREAEIHRVANEPATVTLITGEPGIGKTTLAVHVAHRLALSFPDGVLVVALQHRRGVLRAIADIQRELLETVGLNVEGVRDDILASVWRSWLANRKLLLILDDAPDESSVRLLLPGTSASKVLVTSLSRLSGLESVARIGLGELSAAEGIEFLKNLIGPERVLGDLPAVMAVFDRYGLSPLTLRLLGCRFARLPHVPLSYLADRLGRAESILDEFVAGDVSLRERFEETYNRPSWTHRAAFLTLGALAGPPFSHDELVAALHGTAMPAERVIESLLEANILSVPDSEVTAHSMHYTMSPLAHRFAIELRRTCSL